MKIRIPPPDYDDLRILMFIGWVFFLGAVAGGGVVWWLVC